MISWYMAAQLDNDSFETWGRINVFLKMRDDLGIFPHIYAKGLWRTTFRYGLYCQTTFKEIKNFPSLQAMEEFIYETYQ